MKKIYLLSIVFLILFSSFTPLPENIMELLTSYKWHIMEEDLAKERDPDDPDDPYLLEEYYIYSETTCTRYERWSDEPDVLDTMTVPYYIGVEGSELNVDRTLQSNGRTLLTFHPVQFDDSKVGKIKKGNYILEKDGNDGEATILMIARFEDNKLTLYSVTPETAFGEITLEARPKN